VRSFVERIEIAQLGWEHDLVHTREERELPEPGDGQVLLRVEACGVCHRDLIDREGRFPFQRVPIVPGHEAAGRVLAVGPGVTDVAPGARVGTMHRDACGTCDRCRAGETSLCGSAAWVLGIVADGGYASHLLLPASALYPLPEALSAAEAAVMHCTLGTAWRDLVTLGEIRPGERVIVTGANGGVGAAGVQIAARAGARVTAVLRSTTHAAWVRELGAEDVVLAPDGRFETGEFDLALETVGAPTFLSTLRSLRIGGRLVVVGNVVPERVPVNLGFVVTRGLTVIGGSGATRREMAAVMASHAEQPFEVPLDRTLPLADADRAQRLVRAGGLHGRVVLVPAA
jgi:D-arabinose 1-dehydrogenase-like Zn-dependent alcohol dehydrogenase